MKPSSSATARRPLTSIWICPLVLQPEVVAYGGWSRLR
jgi:hypothetical protein